VSRYDDRLADYVDVKERVRLFYEVHPEGRLVTTQVRATREPDDTPRVWVEAAAYRTPDDPRPGIGWSWMVLPGSTSFTKGSELENTETSAWGRAIGAVGIGIAKSIASADEVRTKGGGEPERAAEDGSLIGTVEVGDKASSDFLLRQTPIGPTLGFRLRTGRGGILVRCTGALADQVVAFRDVAVGANVTCWGRVTDETFTPRGQTKAVTYQVLACDRLSIPGVGILPTDATTGPAAPVDGPVGLTEAESAALWAELDGKV
jgi:hypothetical protein